MSGSTLAMAPAVESTDSSAFHRSHSSPDLLFLRPLPKHSSNVPPTQTFFSHHRHTTSNATTTSTASTTSTTLTTTSVTAPTNTATAFAAASASTPNLVGSSPFSSSSPSSSSSSSSLPSSSLSTTDLTLKSLPSLPAFDVPLFDLDFDAEHELDLLVSGRNRRKQAAKDANHPPVGSPRRVWEEFIRDDSSSAVALPSLAEGTEQPDAQPQSRSVANVDDSGNTFDNCWLNVDNQGSGDNNIGNCHDNTPLPTLDTTIYGYPGEGRLEDARTEAATAESISRRKALLDRPRSWIVSSRSAPDVRDLLAQEREKVARRAAAAAAAAAVDADRHERRLDKTATATGTATAVTTPSTYGERMVERPRTVSSSFADFARRSWISRSPSPSPPTPTTRRSPVKVDDGRSDTASRFGGRLARKRLVPAVLLVDDNSGNTDNNDSNDNSENDKDNTNSGGNSNNSSDGDEKSQMAAEQLTQRSGRGRSGSISSNISSDDSSSTIGPASESGRADGATTTTSVTTTVASTAPTSRAFSRASEYLTRMKQRPQSRFFNKSPTPTAPTATTTITTNNVLDYSGENGLGRVRNSDGNNARNTASNSARDSVRNTERVPSVSLPLPLPLSLGLLSDGSAEPVERSSLLPTAQPAGASRSSSSSCSSSRSSGGDSAKRSTLLAASEAESLTTADTSNHNSPMTHPTSRDPLWVAFKDLETGFFKFLSKTTTAQRMTLVRETLLPFLRRYALDSSNKNTKLLSPEDVERRTSIFNRWWTGLLEMLDGPGQWQGNNQAQGHLFGNGTFFPTSTTTNGNFQTVSGVDRPVVLEAVSMLMSRPEWRLLTAVFRPLVDRSLGERVRARANTFDAPPLDESGFLVEESAEHNVRTMFINNLLAQLILVVDKMAMRQAPLSIVNFSGKACAYAMFFVPGVADILVRLWGLDRNIELVRRAADAFGLPRRSRGESEDLVALFPPCIGPLGWSSVSGMHAKLRRPPKMSLLPPMYVAACSRVPWFAPCWLSRWRGADTDLLFIFCKYYHVLADEFMPSTLQLPLIEKARAPAFVLLHAQLLHIFDNTIHRQAAVEAAMMLAGASMGMGGSPLGMQQQQQPPTSLSSSDDAFLPPMMLQPNHNLFREMDENRIIALLRDLLGSDDSLAGARDTFAPTAMVLLKAATLRTSQYDHNACYILCDFLHEILLAFDNYYGYCSKSDDSRRESTGAPPIDYVDWTFWLDVCKRMLSSNNTMSEIRVLSFVFTTWDIVAADPARKEALCLDWLLSEDVFDKFFNNWCPMVRAYYMRLLCWRMCRDSGSPNELDAKIFLLVSQRLKTVWSHYLWLKQKADKEGLLQPSTVPSLPQPGKRFMIIRTEVNVPQLGLLANTNAGGNDTSNSSPFTSFDALSTSLSSGKGNNSASHDDGRNNLSLLTDDKKTDTSSAKKKWSLLGKVLSLTSGVTSGKSANGEELEPQQSDAAPAKTATSWNGPLPPVKSARLGSPSSDSGSSTGSAPVFDAAQFVFKFMLHNIPWQGFGGGPGGIMLPPAYRERILTRPRLPAPAQARVSARVAALGTRSESPPPPAPGMPPVTRRVSGLAAGGLINEARNANPADSVPQDDDGSGSSSSCSCSSCSGRSGRLRESGHGQASTSLDAGSVVSRPCVDFRRDSLPFSSTNGDWAPNERDADLDPLGRSGLADDDADRERARGRTVVQPVEPKGHTALLRAKYAGRALAEWSLVVNECNSFIDRRRDEGVFGLKDVEVPSLGVEGLRRIG
ncbi:GPI inositol-deacylase [Niveomyces insectorum RCEF 264]|uniref:GPI inositol-deacylase n=1 Tax=Niveomyces insectorum RCEF 264 TaxID=1081102 RepID=A0A162MQZ1_9HYPO|nr:GPI inositol-deacylase [Niveomyces insectorum RCEF 264]